MFDLDKFVEDDDLEITKDVNTVGEDIFNPEHSIMDMLDVKEKIQKKMVPVYLDENLISKLKTVAYKKNLSVANVLEKVVENVTKGVEIDPKAVKKYDKLKGNRGKKNTK